MESKFLFIGGHPALDFLNTEQKDAAGERLELLAAPRSVVEWFAEAGFQRVEADEALLADAYTLRHAIQALVIAWTNGDSPPADALELLNRILATGTMCTFLAGDYTPKVETLNETPYPLLPVAQSALDLLTRHDKNLVRQCAGTECVLWFLDTTKNKRRRWCRMEACGNREKVATHYRRHRENLS
jgi:predicted RNA-binding Zn ribbon-like protein